MKLKQCTLPEEFSEYKRYRIPILYELSICPLSFQHDQEHLFFLGVANDQVIGLAQIEILNDHSAAIRLVGILPDYRRSKKGSKLLSLLENYILKKLSITTLYLNTYPYLRGFYTQNGYQLCQWDNKPFIMGSISFSKVLCKKAHNNNFPQLETSSLSPDASQ